MRLKDKVCIVTGGASGIGEAICRAFDREGAKVAVFDIDPKGASRVADHLADGIGVRCDVADPRSVQQAFAQVGEAWTRVDVLVNNAGIVGKDEYQRTLATREIQLRELREGGIRTPLRATVNLTDEQWLRMIAIHLHGTFFCSRAALPSMEQAGQGVIINMSSINGIDGGLGNAHYATAKSGILGFTRALATEVAIQGIRVNAIAPGFIQTPLRELISPVVQRAQVNATPMGRAGSPDEISSCAVFLASDESSYITGQTISPNGGYLTV